MEQAQVQYGSDHFSKGGDGVTNFSAWQRAIYEEAIRRYGNQSLYVGAPMHPGGSTDFALRCSDLSALGMFWPVFEDVSQELREGFKNNPWW